MKKVFYLIEQLGKLLHMYGVPAESYGLRKKLKTLNSPLKKIIPVPEQIISTFSVSMFDK